MPHKKVNKVVQREPEIESDEGDDNEQILMPDIQNQLRRIIDPNFSENFILTLDPQVQKRVRALQGIQKEINEHREKYLTEHKEIEKRYEVLYEPIFEARNKIVNGKREVTEEEVLEGQKEGNFETLTESEPQDNPVSGIPNFWLTALKHHDTWEDFITTEDECCLKHLENVVVKTFDDPDKGFTIEFHFSENEFFTNNLLLKTYYLLNEDDILLDKAEGCQIDWRPGKNLTVKMTKKKQKTKGGKATRTITKEEPCDSFFNFFKPPQIPDEMDEDEEEMDETLEAQVEADYELGRVIKDSIVPRAVLWFTGEAIENDSDSDSDEDDLKTEEKDEQVN